MAAKEAINSAMSMQGGMPARAQEDDILAKCPDGAAGSFVEGLRHERAGERNDALSSYREAVEKDGTFSEAHGKLGLLLYAKKEFNAAGVELARGLAGRSDPEWHKALGMILLDGGMYSLADYHLGEALKAFGDDTGILEGIAVCRENTGDLAVAEKNYQAVVSRKPDDIKAQLGLARTYLLSDRPDEARRLVESLVRSNDLKEVHELLARIYREQGHIAQAEHEYKLAGAKIEIPPDEYVRKGDGFLLRREYDKAINAYNTALSKHPDWADVLEKIGDAYNAAGQDDEAIEFYRRATSKKDAGVSAWYSLAVLYERKGDLDAAVSTYRTSLAMNPGNGDIRRRLADIYTLKGDFQRASEEYAALIKLRPDNPLLHFKLARIYVKGKKYQDAVHEYLETIRINADNIEGHRELASLYSGMKMPAEAEKHYREVLRLNRNDNDARNALIRICVRKKDYKGLEALLAEAADLNPREPNNYYRLGQLYEFKKDYEKAALNYSKATELNSAQAKAWNGLGRVYLKTGDKARAREAINRSRSIDPQLAETMELLSQVQAGNHTPAKRKHKKGKKG